MKLQTLALAPLILCLSGHATENDIAGKSQSSAKTGKPAPNIVLVVIDDMGWGDFSCFGNKQAKTPNIDQLAEEGIAFDNFYVNSPICSPSRVAISTGHYPQRWRITSYLSNRQHNKARGIAQWLDPKAPMLARSLKAAGYTTGHFGKWHMGGQRDVGEAPLISDYGFEQSLTNFEGLGNRVLPLKFTPQSKEPSKHALGSDKLGRGKIRWQDRSLVTADFTAAALNFIKSSEAAGKPFYVNLWPDDVHTPMHPPLDRWGDGSKTTLYHAVLETMDSQFGVLFNHIHKTERLRENTLIIVCSDNGPEVGFGSPANFTGHKATLFEGGIRSPLIVWAPGLMAAEKTGSRNTTAILSAVDLVASLHTIAGSKVPQGTLLDGENLANTLLGRNAAGRTMPLFFRRPPDRENFRHYKNLPDLAIRDGKWKLLCEYDGSNTRLHDLITDPGEKHNLIKEHPELARRLTDDVTAWHRQMPVDNGSENPR
ncbi:MAG: sulfatase-like hydrolase/transferase [Verrucomicrobiales bacterium]